MYKAIKLDFNYSTTRQLFKVELANESELENDNKEKDEINRSLTNSNQAKIKEGGLRLKGYTKKQIEGSPLLTIVTVVYNGEQFLEETILSVINQNYDNVEYIIVDGGSTDNSIKIIEKYENYIDYWISEKDNGMYEALHKGFSLAKGSIYAWINSDDIYLPGAFINVVNAMKNHSLNWVTGVPTIIDANGNLISIEYPFYYPRLLIRLGFFRGDSLGFIQQESTFFTSKLYWESPLRINFKLASDYFLWSDFAKISSLVTIKTGLSSFRIHPNQKSVDMIGYFKECDKLKVPFYIAIMRKNIIIKKILKIILILSKNRMISKDKLN